MKRKWFQSLLTVVFAALIVALCLWTPGSRTAASAVQEPSAASAPAEMPAPETPPEPALQPASDGDLYVPLAVPNVMVLSGKIGKLPGISAKTAYSNITSKDGAPA